MKIRGNTITVQQISLKLKGGIMKGALDMASHILKGIPAPTEDDHATNKKYVDYLVGKAQTDSETNSKKYADSLTFTKNVTLVAANWVGETAPYTQSIEVEGITVKDNPHYGPVYSADQDARIAQKEAFAMVDDLDTTNGTIIFTCFEYKPEVDIPILLEVNR